MLTGLNPPPTCSVPDDPAIERTLSARLAQVLALDPQAVAIEAGEKRFSWDAIGTAARQVADLLAAAGIPKGAPVGWFAHNRPSSVASFVALVLHGWMVVPLRPRLSASAIEDEIAAQRLCAIVGHAEDWQSEDVRGAAVATGSLGIALNDVGRITVATVPELHQVGTGPHRAAEPGVVLERLTSGTTGPPKRIPVGEDVLIPALRAGEQSSSADHDSPLRLKNSPAILLKPFSHAGGLFGLLLALYQARPMVLIDRFEPAEWAEAVARCKPRSASLVPAMIRMILDAGIGKEKLVSLKAVRSGTAPLDPTMQQEFESRYGIPILVDYGAAEFIGGIAGWTLDDHRRFGTAKRGSVGRLRADVELSLRDPSTGTEAMVGAVGVVHIRGPRFGTAWHRTNDLAMLDEDGFLFLKGRADDAINRGGFKVLPDEVAAVLRGFPGVRDAAVVGKPDARLGEVPVAALEFVPSASIPDEATLRNFVRAQLAPYMVPTEFRIVAELPRTASMKVSRPALKALFDI
jgi:long-chain acyl-CoA synthetase